MTYHPEAVRTGTGRIRTCHGLFNGPGVDRFFSDKESET